MATRTTKSAGELGTAGRRPTPAQLAARLRAAGQRVTTPRLLIRGALTPGQHVSADDVFAQLEHLAPAVNRSTVYRTLELFRDLGLVSETDIGAGVRVFELLEETRHHHLICQRCGKLDTMDDSVVAPLRGIIHERYGFDPIIDHLALFGLCAACRAAEDGQGQPAARAEA